MGLESYKEGIERVDTNVILRLILKDVPQQVKRAKKLFAEDKLFVFEDAAMMEVVFILSNKIYQYPREKVAEKIKTIMHLENLVCNKGIIEGALDLYVTHPKLSFVDCYLAIVADTSRELPIWTFDHKLATQCPSVAREL